ncbi:hypothetical protein [Mycolicibacter sinensis]|uniref:AbiTii domain-containing protein n=1 Tax=Mycolicibacter sinensis (strain JDM601) TaxID=875328 RepID=A0A1A2ER12_MYCSD|nr:hypothetical protein [Mycolicibacter sinensis]OBG06590.1 hypothetical protein A5772_21510 [Mycolicibacter sinensis]OBG09367.1 hypothetical protein A5771_01545 [Mycolicibacter sinensis]
MSDADILRDLREQVLDESESLVSLLRKCLALGAVTGSDDLRAWATNELKGYDDDAPLPTYRTITAPLFVDTVSGRFHSKNQQISRMQIPDELLGGVPEAIDFRQPIEEIIQTATGEKDYQSMGYGTFALVAAKWSAKLPMFQDITALYYKVARSAVAGIVSTVRTTLVEIVIDLAKDVPLDSLPSKAKVDSAVQVHINSNDNNSINVAGDNTGVIGQGAGSTQIQNNTVPTELTDVIIKMREALADINDPEQRADAEQAIDDFDEAVSESDPKPEKIKRRSRALERVTTAIVGGALSQLAKDGVGLALEHFHLLV